MTVLQMPELDVETSMKLLVKQGYMEVTGKCPTTGDDLYRLTPAGVKYVEQNLLPPTDSVGKP